MWISNEKKMDFYDVTKLHKSSDLELISAPKRKSDYKLLCCSSFF